MSRRVLLLMPTTTYKAAAFLAAAEALGVQVVVGTDRRQALQQAPAGSSLVYDLRRPQESVRRIAELYERGALEAVLGTDDETTVLAAMAAEALGLRHNPVPAVRTARDKYETRRLLQAAGLRGPHFRRFSVDEPPAAWALQVGYPCVLKPLALSASRGVLRADDPAEFVQAWQRIASILRQADRATDRSSAPALLVEDYIPGSEVALEGLLEQGGLRALALFDKPDPLEGPVFEETLYITPSRLPESQQEAIVEEAARGCRALGLREGPVHAELRLPAGEPWLIEIAARTIGGLCSRALRFGAGLSLEELVLRHALGLDVSGLVREGRAAGVMMIPIPRAGILREVRGLEQARAEPGIEELTLSLHLGAELVPLPEGHRYLGFIFARGERPEDVEEALRAAHARLRLVID